MSGSDRQKNKSNLARVLGLTIAGGLLGILPALSSAPSLAREENDLCTIWPDVDSSLPFVPKVMEIRLNGDVAPDMENKLFDVLQDNLTVYPSLKTIKILLSSRGGLTESGFRIHNYLRGLHERHGLQVVTQNTGSVQSAAIDVYCGGNQRIASPHSVFMVHDQSQELDGSFDVKAIRDLEEENRLDSAASYSIFSACTNLPVADVAVMFAEQTYFDPEQALALGLAHSITPATYDRSADIRCLIEADDERPGE